MNVHDEMPDTQVLRTASESLTALPIAGPPAVAEVMARGQERRRRRVSAVAGLSAAGAVGLALGLSLTGVSGPSRSHGTIRTASFTLTSNSDGTDTLTLSPTELLEPSVLQNDLAQDGIPAIVNSGSFCTSPSAPAGFSQVVSMPSGPSTATPADGTQPTITIDPSAIPAGTELSFGYFQLTSGPASGEQEAEVVLVNTDSYTCSSTPPDLNGSPAGYGEDDALGLLYGGPGPGGS